ncbi:MAG: flagellar hook-basal body complex protein [Cognatishimia sp.]|uniref:flagellar hook-basal body complex protein n=1 Tax=Cognatishimia sp. 1_MG-2023 TaxID=3062642 RepID=UPI0026E37C3B|nr:flagellar hook-basal body complex protein [Cognatishimia sp. 1_MG-2023]MDO6727931.1 flagellar hook-basal body complex protein [Cognatishimia sp. 1_MG-2023]
MGTTNYVSLSLATALERSLDLAAHNMANASTAGFKTSHPLLEAVDPKNSGDKTQAVNYVKDNGIYVDTSQGAMVPTGNPLDVAVNGSAWLGYETPGGDVAYGRDGRLTIDNEGRLTTVSGSPVVDISGSPITVPQEAGQSVTIAIDGTITDQDGGQIGRIGLFEIGDPSSMNALGNGLFLPPAGANPEQTETSTISQGYVEQSNVKPVVEMIHLMDIQRAYERAVKLMDDENNLTKQAIQRLGRVV